MAIQTSSVFISAACNTFSQTLAWAHEDYSSSTDEKDTIVVAYAAYNWIALATASGQVIRSLRGHKGVVQCVQWLVPSKELVSGSADGTVRLWSSGQSGLWSCSTILRVAEEGEHTLAVSKLTTLRCGSKRYIAAATAQSVTIWQQQAKEDVNCSSWTLSFRVQLPSVQIPTSVALIPLNNEGKGEASLWVGCVDTRIHVWSSMSSRQDGGWVKDGSLSGHQGWVRALDWRPLEDSGGGILVASGSQDGKIRIWRVEALVGGGGGTISDRVVGVEEEGYWNDDPEEEDDHEIRLLIGQQGGSQRYGVRLDALLIGHEDWVTGVQWSPELRMESLPAGEGEAEEGRRSSSSRRPLQLLSCSMDRSLIIWRPEGTHGVWIPQVRLGDLGADLGGAVGGNLLGFLGCVYDSRGEKVLAHGFGGSFHAYQRDATAGEEDGEEGGGGGLWRPYPFSTGHFEEVTDMQWDPEGRYLVSVSKDQTTRLWAPALSTTTTNQSGCYHEMSRVQVHGYDLTCVDLLPSMEHRLVSGADEKTLRVFDATSKVLGLLQDLSGIHSSTPARVETAYVPALALSNKAVAAGLSAVTPTQEEGPGTGKEDAEAIAKAKLRMNWRRVPLEGELVDHTLWPEIAKLYGHGNGITCLTSDRAGSLLASACKARDAEMAQVRLWDTSTWRSAGVLPGHQSTVVQLAFSHDDKYLVSVSKDRQICLYGRRNTASSSSVPFEPVQTLPRAHKRIIWSCDWSHDDSLLATGSRDGSVKLWKSLGGKLNEMQTIKPGIEENKEAEGVSISVTSVAFAPIMTAQQKYILAIGLESGDIELWIGDKEGPWVHTLRFDDNLSHTARIQRLRWKPVVVVQDEKILSLASCGTDHAVKIVAIRNF